MIELVSSVDMRDGAVRLPDGRLVDTVCVRIIDLETGDTPKDEAGRAYGCIAASTEHLEAYSNDAPLDGDTWATQMIPGRFAIVVAMPKADRVEQQNLQTEVERLCAHVAKLDGEWSATAAKLESAQAELERTKVMLAEQCEVNDEIDAKRADLTVALARMAHKMNVPVQVSAAGPFMIRVGLDLPTGPVDYHVDNNYADLLAGLPFGLRDTPVAGDETQALRLTQAFHPAFSQTLIPEPVTPERVLAALEPTRAHSVSGKRSFPLTDGTSR